MSTKALKGLAKLREIFSKAQPGSELDVDLDELEQLKTQGNQELEDEDDTIDPETGQPYAEIGDDGMETQAPVMAKADTGEPVDVDATELVMSLAQSLSALNQRMAAIENTQTTLVKAQMAMIPVWEEMVKSVTSVQGQVQSSAVLPRRTGQVRQVQQQRKPQTPEVDFGEVLAKATTDHVNFPDGAQVIMLESMLRRGDLAAIQSHFSPEQLSAIGLSLQGVN